MLLIPLETAVPRIPSNSPLLAVELAVEQPNLRRDLPDADQEPWKLPLPTFIESRYHKRFGKDRPDVVHSREERVRLLEQKKATRREAKRLRREGSPQN